MKKEVKTFEQKFNLGPSRKRISLTNSDKVFFKESSERSREVIRRGKSYMKYSDDRFGYVPNLPITSEYNNA